jgi:hydrogenase maturation factor
MGAMMNEDRFGVVTFTFDPASVAAATSAEQTVTVSGLKTGDVVALTKPTATAGVGIVNVRVSAANTLAVTFMNATASSVDPASETYTLFWFRPEKTVSGAVNP